MVMQDVGGGVSLPVRQGASNFEASIMLADPTWLSNVQGWEGKTIGVFNIDAFFLINDLCFFEAVNTNSYSSPP